MFVRNTRAKFVNIHLEIFIAIWIKYISLKKITPVPSPLQYTDEHEHQRKTCGQGQPGQQSMSADSQIDN